MKNAELNRQVQVIRSLFSRISTACGDDIEMRAHWAKYLCVQSAGFLENAISELYAEFCLRAASEPVSNYAITQLRKLQNPKASRFVEVAGSFKIDWGHQLQAFLDDEGRGEAIDSIMSNRHRIAHGQSSNISAAQLLGYFDKCLKIVEYIEKQLAA